MAPPNKTRSNDLHRGEGLKAPKPLPEDISPDAAATQIADGLTHNARQFLFACYWLVQAAERFKLTKAKWSIFVSTLAERRILSDAEIRAGVDSGKFWKLVRLGNAVTILLRDELLFLLKPEYSWLYEALQLFETIDGDDNRKIAELARFLSEHEPSRSLLEDEKRRLIAAKKTVTINSPGSLPTAHSPTAALRPEAYDLVFIETDSSILQHFRADYADPGVLRLRVADQLAPAAAAVIITNASQLGTVTARLLPNAGFDRLTSLYLRQRPDTPDITDQPVLAVAVRGAPPIVPMGDWPRASLSAASLAGLLFPTATSKIQLFANESAPGWDHVSLEHCWVERPSLK